MSELQRAMIGYPIHSDAATLSGGDWETTLPLSYMQTRDHTEVARSTNDSNTATQFDEDLGTDSNDWLTRVVAIFAHNISKAATWRVTIDNDVGFGSPVFQSTWVEAIPQIYPTGVLESYEPGGSDGYPVLGQPGTAMIMFVPAGTVGRYRRIEIDDTTNPDGYVEIGRYIAGPAWQLGQNFVVGAGLGVSTKTIRDESEGGTFLFTERPQRRDFVCTFDHLEQDEALVRVHDFQMLVGTSKQFLWLGDPSNSYHMHRNTFPAVMERLSPIEYPDAYLRREVALQVTEEF